MSVTEDAGWEQAQAVSTDPGWRPPAKAVIALQVPYSATSGRATLPVAAVSVTPLAPAVRVHVNASEDSSSNTSTSTSTTVVSRWLYTFNRNVVGHAAVVASAVANTGAAAGNLTLRHCENVNTTLGADQTYCLALAHLVDQPDTHILPAGFEGSTSGAQRGLLTPRFTWHGFQYVHGALALKTLK